MLAFGFHAVTVDASPKDEVPPLKVGLLKGEPINIVDVADGGGRPVEGVSRLPAAGVRWGRYNSDEWEPRSAFGEDVGEGEGGLDAGPFVIS